MDRQWIVGDSYVCTTHTSTVFAGQRIEVVLAGPLSRDSFWIVDGHRTQQTYTQDSDICNRQRKHNTSLSTLKSFVLLYWVGPKLDAG